MTTDKPTSPADPRPNDEPYYIDSECPECGTELELEAEVKDEDYDMDEVWHDEWMCPNEECEKEGVFMDVPESFWKKLESRKDEDTIPLEEVDIET